MLEGILTEFFQSDYEPQLPYVFGWLKAAQEMMHAQTAMPGQCLILAGPRNSGKSLFQDLVTQMLGGRAGLPYRYVTPKKAGLILSAGIQALRASRYRNALGCPHFRWKVHHDFFNFCSCHRPCWLVGVQGNLYHPFPMLLRVFRSL